MIIPSIDIMDGRAVQLRRGEELVIDAGDPMALLEQFRVVGPVAVIDLDAARGTGSNAELIRTLVRVAPCRVGGGIRDLATARQWLDEGAEHIIIGTAATPDFCAALPRDRLIAAVDARGGSVVTEGWTHDTGRPVTQKAIELAPFVDGFLFTQVEHEGMESGFDFDVVQELVDAVPGCRVTAAGGVRDASDIAGLDAVGADAQVGMALYTGRLALGDAVGAVLTRAVDGLWPTVVCDEHGVALGLTWSSPESLRLAVDRQRGVYWSRSRREIWEKGRTSGHTQELVRVDVDCDRDALRFLVRQHGPFCHTGTRSCWGRTGGLGAAMRRMQARKAARDTKSVTARLLTDRSLLNAKLLEEVAELTVAEGSAEVTHEAADVMYFTLAAMLRADVTIESVMAELDRRGLRVTRRPVGQEDTGV